jgi:hypothetical protein
LDKTATNTYDSWTTRTTALNDEISKTKDEISIQQQAYEAYMKKANSISLSETYKQKVREGKIQIEDITDEDLSNAISDYQTYYEKAIECSDAVQELTISLGELAEQKFDDLKTQYEDTISLIEAYADIVNEKISRTEEHGYFVSKSYYEQLIAYEKQELSELQGEYDSLVKSRDEAVASGSITEGSEAWNEMTQEILDVQKSIEEATTSLVEFNNEIRQLDWDIFDYIEDRIDQITQESEFLIDLLGDDLYDDNGAFNDKGISATALRGINYNTYMQKSLDYAEELKEVEEELAKDTANQDLIERREELLKLQQEAISNANSEKEAIKSLVEEGIKVFLDSLSDLIDKYESALDSAKSLYEYQTSIADKTEEIAKLEKTLAAYSGDDSEESRKRIQETQTSLDDAKKELKETEWDEYISETKDLLSDLYDDMEETLNARLDDLDGLVSDMIDMVNQNADTVKTTIETESEKVGYTITDAMNTIVTASKTDTIISAFNKSFDTKTTTLQTSIDKIKDYVYSMTDKGKAVVETESKAAVTPVATTTPTVAKQATTSNTQTKPTTTQGNGSVEVGDQVTFVSGKYHEDSWGNGKSGSKYQGQKVYITKIASSSPYPYHISTGTILGNGDLGWLKLDQISGYAVGSKRITSDQLAWTQENGGELIYRSSDGAILTPLNTGDKVFTNEMSERLWDMAQGTVPNMSVNTSSIPDVSSRNTGTINNDNKISITLPNVTNYDEFKQKLQSDSNFEKFMQEVTIGQALGKNTLNKKKY